MLLPSLRLHCVSEYKTYIWSRVWKQLSLRIKRRDKRCLICGTKANLAVHHGTYANLGQEFDEELFTLCGYHHEELHKKFKKRKKSSKESLLSFTKRFVSKTQTESQCKRGDMVIRERCESLLRTPQVEEYKGAFVDIFTKLSKQFPKKEKSKEQPFIFKSRNQLIMKEVRKKKKEKRSRRLERRRQKKS